MLSAAWLCFALGRVIDSSRRGSVAWEAFGNELKLKCNKFIILDELLRKRCLEE